MILYFSATGNSRYVAERVGAAIGEEIVSIQDVSAQRLTNVSGIVSPAYAWGIPSIVDEFLQTHTIEKDERPLFYIVTYGTTPGQSRYWAEKALRVGSGISFDAAYGVRMPDTWTPMFDLSDKVKVAQTNAKVEPQLDEIIKLIKSEERGNHIKNRLPAIARVVYRPYYNMMRKTKHFFVEDSCTGCGLCAKNCPDQAIEIKDGKPVWVKDKCVICLGCLHRCPKFAIQYGSKTKEHGQYRNPNVKL